MTVQAPQERRLGALARQLQSSAAPDALRHEHSAAPAVVVGGLVMDIQAHPDSGGADVQRGGSVPGAVVQTPGGVARNIAVALAQRLGAGSPPPLLVSCVGRDASGEALAADLACHRLPLRGLLRPPGKIVTATVSVVFDRSGEVAAAVADVAVIERALTPAVLHSEFSHDIAAAPLLVADANLSLAALEEVCRVAAAAQVPVWFEPVSAPKSIRATAVLRHLTFVSPNAAELAAMAAATCQAQNLPPPPVPIPPQDSAAAQQLREAAAAAAAQLQGPAGRQEGRQPDTDSARRQLRLLAPHIAVLLRAGVRHVVLTLGADGAALATLQRNEGSTGGAAYGLGLAPAGGETRVDITHLPAEPAAVASASGAGDCLAAGAAAALLRGRPPDEALAHGMAAAHSAIESHHNVPAKCDLAAEASRSSRLHARRRRWVETVPSHD